MTEPMDDELVLDGNAVAGLLLEVFGTELTAAVGMCDNCERVGAVGGLRAWTRGPGVVLRCVSCDGVMLRVVRTPRGVVVDLHGMRHIRMPVAP